MGRKKMYLQYAAPNPDMSSPVGLCVYGFCFRSRQEKDVVTGDASRIPGSDAHKYYLTTLSFDANRGKIFSLGLDATRQNRTLVSMDVASKAFTQLSTLSRFNTLMAELATID